MEQTISYLGYTIQFYQNQIWNDFSLAVWDSKGEVIMLSENITSKEELNEQLTEVRHQITEIVL